MPTGCTCSGGTSGRRRRLWSATDGKAQLLPVTFSAAELRGNNALTSLTVSPDGNRLVADSHTGRLLTECEGPATG